MGPKQLAGVMSIVQRAAAERAGRDYDEEADAAMREAIEAQIEAESTALFATGQPVGRRHHRPPRHPHRARHRAVGRALALRSRAPRSFGVFRM